MKRICFLLMSCLLISSALQAQISTEVQQAYQSVKKNLLAAADKVPEEDYSFKPTPEVRSFAQVFSHVVMAQSHTCSALVGSEPPAPSQLSTKKEVQTALESSFTLCDRAYDSLTDANATGMIKTPRGERTRLGILVGNTTHDVEQYATLAVYMRLKGLVPPLAKNRSIEASIMKYRR